MLVYKIKSVPSKDTDLKSKKRLWLRVDDLLYAHFSISVIDVQYRRHYFVDFCCPDIGNFNHTIYFSSSIVIKF